MPKYNVQITETLQRIIEVEAEDEDMAIEQIEGSYQDCDIVLDAEDFKDVDYEVVE